MPRPAEIQSATPLKPRIIGWLVGNLGRLLISTLRVKITDDSGILARPPDQGVIWMFWHNRLLAIPGIYYKYASKLREASVLTSASRDGAIGVSVLRCFSLSAVRGSSSRRGAQALVECRRVLKKNHYLGITPDGPRGPVYQLQPGVVQLARLCRVPIVPIRVEYSNAWRLKTWDRFFIPKPFSKVQVHFLPLVHIETDDLEAHRSTLTELLKPEIV